MVRIRAREKPMKAADGLARQSGRKRKLGESVEANSNGQSTSGNTEVSSRSSKRTRTTHLPYQSPESVGAILQAVTERKKTSSKTKNEATPKKGGKKDMVKAPKRPAKPVKRLQKQISPRKPASTPRVRRKIFKSPVPAKKPAVKATNSRTNKTKIAKQLQKVGKIVTKTIAIKPVKDAATKKRKLTPGQAKLQQEDSAPSAKTKKKTEKESKRKNGKLSPKSDLTNYEKDPTFETRKEIPFISTLSHSRLVIRAVIMNDMKMLKKLVLEEPENIYSVSVPRSSCQEENVFDYICKYENKEAFNILQKIPEKVMSKFASRPTMMISSESTGSPSHMMFGHAMRQVSVGRGGKEGNNAFLYDSPSSYHCGSSLTCKKGMVERAVELGASLEFVEFLKTKLSNSQWDYVKVHIPLRKGHYEIAGQIIAKANERGGYGFNFLHEEVLTKKTVEELTSFKPVSVTKKCTYDPRFSPLHCAAINPNGKIIAELLQAMPDYNLVDKDGWSVGHYAAVCSSPEPLKHLLHFGITTQAVTSTKRGGDGFTLLHAAVSAGRAHNVRLLLDHEKEAEKQKKDSIQNADGNDENEDAKKKQKVLLQNDIRYKMTTSGRNPLQMACELGHADIVRLLLDAETDPNRQMPAKQDSVTPLMLATMHGHLDIVKILVDAGVKVDAKDKRGRTAAHHAAMNGQAHILSYLLRLGVNHLALDSSGNSLLHYSAAYGWYFATLLLLEAGCPPNAPNYWKMTPMAATFLKGHIGLVTVLMKQEGVDVNARIDDNGRTLLLQTCESGWDIAKLKFLVEELKADPKCEDFNGNNALHLISTQKLQKTDRYVSYRENENFPKELKAFNECLTYLVEKGCDPCKKNIAETSSILSASARNNFYFVSKLLEMDVHIPFEKDEYNNTLLHYMVRNFTESDTIIYSVFTKLCSNNANSTALKEMAATHNKEGLTPLLMLAQARFEVPNEEYKTKIINIIDTFLSKLRADVNAKVEGDGKSKMTLLHYTAGTYVLPTVLKYKPDMDPLDVQSRTPLASAVANNQKQAAEDLINAGANVNYRFKCEDNISLILYVAMKEGHSFSLIPKLIAKGANPREVHPKTKNSILHYIARKPNLHHAVETVKVVLDAGVSPNLTNSSGQTPLHIVVNARGSETDVFYDIEDALMCAGANFTVKDNRGRIPLHYCFVKKGNPTDKSFFDPIELVSHLVTAMKTAKASQLIHCTDVYGSSPLHYAAFRGATICCSYLMQSLPQGRLDISDNNGNTPFGLAVRNAHEGCALNLFQKDADFLRTINNNIQIIEIQTEQATIAESDNIKSKREELKWNHIQKQEEEKQQLTEQREKYPILEQIVKNDWQGLLYLMIGQLQASGTGFSIGISTALKLQRLKLALKITMKVKDRKELMHESGTLFHTLAKYFNGQDMEVAVKICEAFRKAGLNSAATDEFGSQSVIYALINQQSSLCNALYGGPKDCMKLLAFMKPDSFGRTPFTSLFWKVDRSPLIDTNLQPFTIQLLTAGSDPNFQCEYPITLTSLPGVRYIKKMIDIVPSINGTKYPPLILAVIANCYATVKWLLTMKKTGPFQININCQDSKGRTAIMHAVRLNDVKMVKLLLDPSNYNYEEDTDRKKDIKVKSSHIDLTIRDKKGWTVMDYLMFSPGTEYYYKNVQPIFHLLQQVGSLPSIVSRDGLKPLDKAVKNKRADLIDIISKYTYVPPAYKKSALPDQYFDFTSVFSQDITLTRVVDYESAAEKMADKLAEQAREKLRKEGKNEEEKPKPDPLCGLEKDNADLMIDQQQNIPYDCLMTKVDLSYGIHGLYNFYKMQLIKQPRGKEMILLFTEWGRVGQTGQYQKTPFATAEEAIKEFTKIFKQKSGNAWEDVQNFTPAPNKYRLVPKDLRTVKRYSHVAVNFEELEKAGKNVRSSLPGRLLGLMRNLCCVHTDAASTYGRRGWRSYEQQPDYFNLPLLPTDVLMKAEAILEGIDKQIIKNEALQKDTSGKNTEKERVELMDEIVKLSEEFYQLIPVYGFATQNLQPMFSDEELREKRIAINRILHLETAKSLLLGAQYNMEATNPFEYVYRCLNTQIQMLDGSNVRDKEEMEIILQYIHNTGNAKVYGIYRVEISKENERLNATNIHNRQLLWHGTSSANLLSILQQGLQVAPLGSRINGHLFGKGIYLADIFEKSEHYCGTVAVNGQTRKFMLLCEAALGNVYEVELDCTNDKPMPKGFDSLKTSDSRYDPDPESTIVWKGRTVALGKKMERPLKKDESWYSGLDFNEYIIFNPDQVAVRYLIEFE